MSPRRYPSICGRAFAFSVSGSDETDDVFRARYDAASFSHRLIYREETWRSTNGSSGLCASRTGPPGLPGARSPSWLRSHHPRVGDYRAAVRLSDTWQLVINTAPRSSRS